MQVSSKVLIDIPFTGKIKGNEKIIFLRKKDFSIESISLRIRNFFYGKKMMDAAANHVKNLLSLPSINQLPEVRQLSASIDEKKEVATEDVINIFMKFEHENQFNLLIGKPISSIKIPNEMRSIINTDELSSIINEKIKSKLTNELQILNNLKIEEPLPKENLNEVISLLRKSQPDFDEDDANKLNHINDNDFSNDNPIFNNASLEKSKGFLKALNEIILKNEKSSYKKKIELSIANLISKIDLIKSKIEESEVISAAKKTEQTKLKNAQHQTLIDKLSNLLSKHSLTTEFKNKEIPNEGAFNVLNNALFKNVENETIKEYLTPMSHYLVFGEISINKTTAPILEHLLKDEDNFISNMKRNIKEADKPIYRTNARGNKTVVHKDKDYPLILSMKLDQLKKDIKNFNSQLESEKRE